MVDGQLDKARDTYVISNPRTRAQGNFFQHHYIIAIPALCTVASHRYLFLFLTTCVDPPCVPKPLIVRYCDARSRISADDTLVELEKSISRDLTDTESILTTGRMQHCGRLPVDVQSARKDAWSVTSVDAGRCGVNVELATSCEDTYESRKSGRRGQARQLDNTGECRGRCKDRSVFEPTS